MSFEQHIFLSDVHLGAFSAKTNKQIEEDLLALIEYCKQRHIELHILGDLFDYWMEFPEKGFVP
ncbi:MAG TPA: UDP-2,3-diacylglucosamine diphosphatase, partial [Balneolaceae bacterium]|nr:UDP-2,3-diacylglucosamine diphosphatase [Balneolaceae bacterium]